MKKKSTRSLCFPRGLQYLIAMLKLWIKSSPVAENDRVCNIAFCTPRPHRAFHQRVTSKSPWRLLASLAMSYLDPLNDSFALMRKGLASGYNCPLGGALCAIYKRPFTCCGAARTRFAPRLQPGEGQGEIMYQRAREIKTNKDYPERRIDPLCLTSNLKDVC